VVIQEHKSNSILAFSPRPKKEDEPHHFYFNGSKKSEDTGKPYQFKLSEEGLSQKEHDRDSRPEINPGLKDFSFRTERWRVGDSLIMIELPAPRRITFSDQRSPVTFRSGHRPAFMPRNHILEYGLNDSAQPKLECNESSIRCEPALDSFPGVTRYFFEIGPKRSLDPAQSHAHAISFFNYILQQSFPDLAEQFQLETDSEKKRQAQSLPRAVPAMFQYGSHNPELQDASYIVDCEYTGPLATTKSAPLMP
jgi:hypothetical protein